MNTRALWTAIAVGSVLQLLMVVVGHSNPSVANLFAVGGMGISFLAGIIYGVLARGGSTGSRAIGGLVAGGVCAFIGIVVSYVLKDVTASILVIGTASSAVTGAIGGFVGKLVTGGARSPA
jgi:hypothetical protein